MRPRIVYRAAVRAGLAAVAVIVWAACAQTADPGATAGAGASGDDERAAMPPANTIPCNHPEYWRHTLRSTAVPLHVHYMKSADKAVALEVQADLERAWRVSVGELGWRPPPSDRGSCGGDGAFDVYLWRGHRECYVDPLDAAPGAAWDARTSYMVVDPWGPYGGAILDSTLAHELNHAFQAADDWSDCAIVYEMTADFMQKVVVPSDTDYKNGFVDFQAHPDWSLDRDDGYRTWYSYGSALYLFYLRERHFGGDPRFVAEMWLRMRNPPGADDDPTRNHPSFEDALDGMLLAHAGTSFLGSVVGLARWRWYTAARDDGHHFTDGATFAAVAATAVAARPARIELDPAPMVLGSSYVQVIGAPAAAGLTVSLASSAPVRWVVQAVPGLDGSDGEVLDVAGGPAPLTLGPDGSRTLIITALPRDAAAYEPNRKHDKRYPATLVLAGR